MVTYLTSLFALSAVVIPTTLNEFFDYGLGCLRQGYKSDGGTGLILAGPLQKYWLIKEEMIYTSETCSLIMVVSYNRKM
jgi:hypothetical protein